MQTVILELLDEKDREQFILDNQEAFRYGALEEFGQRDNHFEEDGEIISRATIEKSIKEIDLPIWTNQMKNYCMEMTFDKKTFCPCICSYICFVIPL